MNVANVVPFPLACRRASVDRHARLIAAMSADAGERYLDRQLRIQFENLQRRGIDREIIDREVVSLDAARSGVCSRHWPLLFDASWS
jgi:hypothetical protein